MPPVYAVKTHKMPGTRSIQVRFVLVIWLFLLSAVAFLDRTNLLIAAISLRSEYKLSYVQLGRVLSAFSAGYAIFQVPGGWLAGRIGPRRLLTLGLLWWGLFTILTTTVPTHIKEALALLVAVRFALGAGEAVVYPASNQFVARWFPVQERGIANGWIFAGVGAGSTLAPLLLPWIITHHGWRASFWFSALVGFFAGVGWYLIARDTPQEHPFASPEEVAHIQEGLTLKTEPEISAASVDSTLEAGSLWLRIARSPSVWAVTFSYFTYGYVAWIFFTWFYTYLVEVRHVDLKVSARYTMLPFIAMTVCCLLGGVLNDWATGRYGLRVGRCFLASLSLVLAGAFLVFGSTLHSAQSASIVLSASVGALYLSQSSYWSITADIAGTHAGLVSGIMNMGAQVGGFVTALLTPVIAGRFGWNVPFFVAAALAALGGLAWLLVNPTRRVGS
jgi:ACS family glucarate transporter-like MFS transporter